MHRLDRNSVPAPLCITPHDPTQQYGDLRGPQYAEIRRALMAMQQRRCAYCERRTGEGGNDGHIEHFRNQSRYPAHTTDWNNLFWSCSDRNFCGVHKDTCNIRGSSGKCRDFDPADVVDPCIDDPDLFMRFISDGSIQPRENLTPAQQRRYQETLRIFQLAEAAFLVDSRRDAVQPYIDALNDLKPEGPERIRAYVARQLVRVGGYPFETAIRHFLASYAP